MKSPDCNNIVLRLIGLEIIFVTLEPIRMKEIKSILIVYPIILMKGIVLFYKMPMEMGLIQQ